MKELKTANSTGYWTGILGTFGVAQYSKANNTYVAIAVIPLIYGWYYTLMPYLGIDVIKMGPIEKK